MRWSVEDERLLIEDEYRTKRGLFEMRERWWVAVADSPYNGDLMRCQTLIGAIWTALVFRLAGWHVQITHANTCTAVEAVQAIKETWRKV